MSPVMEILHHHHQAVDYPENLGMSQTTWSLSSHRLLRWEELLGRTTLQRIPLPFIIKTLTDLDLLIPVPSKGE
jgi:hypothetical protein